MRMILPTPIQPTAVVFAPLRTAFLALASDAAAARDLWAGLEAAIGAECLAWFRMGEALSESEAYDRGKRDGEQDAWNAIALLVESGGSTAFGPRGAC